VKTPDSVQGWTGTITGIAAVFLIGWGVYNHFTTDAEAQGHHAQLIAQHEDLEQHTEVVEQALTEVVNTLTDASNRAEINRSRRELKRIRFMLENSSDMTPAAKKDLEDDEKYYEDLIVCIKSGQKFCDD
jgi:hypothetical protein